MNHAGLILLTVGLGYIFVDAADWAFFRRSGSPLIGAALPGHDPVPSYTLVVLPVSQGALRHFYCEILPRQSNSDLLTLPLCSGAARNP